MKNFMHSFVKRPSTMYKTLPQWTTLHTYCYSQILFVIFYLKDCSQVRGSGSTMFYKNASASGSSKSQMLPRSFFKVLPIPQKFNRFHCFRFHIPG